MAETTADLLDFKRWRLASGRIGLVASIMVLIASRIDGFDWRVFLLAGGALCLMWSRNFALVPIHLRFEQAEADRHFAYSESDWIFVDAVGEMSGSEIDTLREAYKAADNETARAWLRSHFPEFGDDEAVRFARFFLRRFVGDCDVDLNETGHLVRWE